jgi:hypothetical protein
MRVLCQYENQHSCCTVEHILGWAMHGESLCIQREGCCHGFYILDVCILVLLIDIWYVDVLKLALVFGRFFCLL